MNTQVKSNHEESDYFKNMRVEKEIRLQKIDDAASQIATILGGKLKEENEPCEYRRIISFPCGSALYMRADWQRQKYKISGMWPTGIKNEYKGLHGWYVIPYTEQEPSMGFSMTRTPADIGKAILKRFIPEYNRLYALCLAAKTEQDKFYNYKAGLITRLSKIGGELRTFEDGRESVLYVNTESLYTTIKTSSNDVSLDIKYLSEEKAARIIKILCEK